MERLYRLARPAHQHTMPTFCESDVIRAEMTWGRLTASSFMNDDPRSLDHHSRFSKFDEAGREELEDCWLRGGAVFRCGRAERFSNDHARPTCRSSCSSGGF